MEQYVVWWALPLGGALGGIARVFLARRVEFPYFARERLTGQLILIPGFLGQVAIAAIAALVVGGAAAATFSFQGGFEARGFWGPLVASISAGLAAAQTLTAAANGRLDGLEKDLLSKAEGKGE